jgi:hypothetical protein
MNNEFKQLREIIENENGSVFPCKGRTAFLNMGKITASFYAAGKHC